MLRNEIRKFANNELIFRDGDPADCAYLIERGHVLVTVTRAGSELTLRILNAGEVFGEMSLIDDKPRSATCRSMGDTELIVVSRDQLLDRMHSADPVVRLMIRALMERLRTQTDTLRGETVVASAKTAGNEVEKKEAVERIALEDRILLALKNDEFVPFYQPIYDLNTFRVTGFEALIRWITPDGETIPPSVFMDVVEGSTIVLKAGRMIVQKCMSDLPELLSRFAGSESFFLSINIGGRQFADAGFVEHLESVRKNFGLSAANVKLELTERVMMEGPQAFATLRSCREHGYSLAIDDFGTGFSSLQYLASMPLNDLKIDRSFVMNMRSDKKSLSIVKALIHLANLLGLGIIAEGIETAEELELLKSLGVSSGQGFYFAKAMPLAQIRQLPVRFAA